MLLVDDKIKFKISVKLSSYLVQYNQAFIVKIALVRNSSTFIHNILLVNFKIFFLILVMLSEILDIIQQNAAFIHLFEQSHRGDLNCDTDQIGNNCCVFSCLQI